MEKTKVIVNVTKVSNEEIATLFEDNLVIVTRLGSQVEEAIDSENFRKELASDKRKRAFFNNLIDYAEDEEAYAIVMSDEFLAKEILKNILRRRGVSVRVLLLRANSLFCEGDIKSMFIDEFYLANKEIATLEEGREYIETAIKNFIGFNDNFDLIARDFKILTKDDKITTVEQMKFFLNVLVDCLEGKIPEYYGTSCRELFAVSEKKVVFSAITAFFEATPLGIEREYDVKIVPVEKREDLKQAVKKVKVEPVLTWMKEFEASHVITENVRFAHSLADNLGLDNVFLYKENGEIVSLSGKHIGRTSKILEMITGKR